MADKKSPAEGWPVINGDYIAGDPESPVAVACLASHIEQIPVDAGAAIAGPCKTENLGIEKMISNLISNPNLRFLNIMRIRGSGTRNWSKYYGTPRKWC